ncbi:MAG TPA: 50S ribosomal protein L19 [Patescibacteria group bacterium]|nr:50S ribosomal protein L19 [Patescibacteria group bacterium]
MALTITFKETEFGIGDRIRVVQKIKDGEKFREAAFEGMVLKIKGRNPGKTITVRKIAEGNVGVERIFPLELPSIDKIIVVKRGVEGVRRAKLYYTREKSPTEVDMIFKKAAKRVSMKSAPKKKNK